MNTKLETGVDRLLFLAAFLDTVNEDKFDLGSWRDSPYSSSITDSVLIHECRSTACAVGWACSLPEFQELGLKFEIHHPIYMDQYGVQIYGWDAVESFFDLEPLEAQHLFSDLTYLRMPKTSNAVASRIREFVKTRFVP